MYIIVVLIFTRATLPRYVYIIYLLLVYVLRTYIKTDDDLLIINKAINIYRGSESQRGVEIQINI